MAGAGSRPPSATSGGRPTPGPALAAGSAVAGPALRLLAALDEVDDRRHPLQAVALAQPVLQEVGVVAGDPGPRVDLDREARRTLGGLSHEDETQPVAGARPLAAVADRRLADRDRLGQEAVELRGGDPGARPVGERDRLHE